MAIFKKGDRVTAVPDYEKKGLVLDILTTDRTEILVKWDNGDQDYKFPYQIRADKPSTIGQASISVK